MNTPSDSALRPRTINELIAQTRRIYRAHFIQVIGLVALITIPVTILNSVIGTWLQAQLLANGPDVTTLTGRADAAMLASLSASIVPIVEAAGLSLLIGLVGALLRAVLVDSTLTYLASESEFGRQASLGEAFAAVRGRLTVLATGLFLFYVLLTGMLIVLALILFACGLGLGLLAYVYVVLGSLLTPVLVLERTSPLDALRRAWKLGKTRIWALVALIIGIALLSFLMSLIVGGLEGALIPESAANSTAAQVIDIVLQAGIAIVLAPILPIGVTLVYYDARLRNENLTQLLTAADKRDARPADIVSPELVKFMTNDDYLNLGLIVAGTFVLVLI